jgi:phosphoglycolate phosphatase
VAPSVRRHVLPRYDRADERLDASFVAISRRERAQFKRSVVQPLGTEAFESGCPDLNRDLSASRTEPWHCFARSMSSVIPTKHQIRPAKGSLVRPPGYLYGFPVIDRVLLWDVDGTLVKTGGLGGVVFDVALERVLGVRPEVRPRMSGKTDPQIVREYLSDMGIEETPELVQAVLRHIERELAAVAATGRLAAEGKACPGVATILAELATRPSVLSSLVTGNVYPNAVVKVAAFGLDKWLNLSVGAYGSDDHDRRLLVPRAMARVAEQTGWRADPDQVWVIGDTPRDLDCARSAGVRCLLVGTGRCTPIRWRAWEPMPCSTISPTPPES